LAGISSEETKFCYVISQLDHRYATEVEDIITSLPERDPYSTLRTELMRRLFLSREQQLRQLFTLKEMGDRKTSQFLTHFRSLAPDVPDDFFHSIWSGRLRLNVRVILAGQLEDDLDPAARCADRIIEAALQAALPHSLAGLHFCNGFKNSPARWQHSAPSGPTLAPTPGTPAPAPGTAAHAVDPPPKMTLHPPFAGTIAAMEPGRKSVLSPAPAASGETDAADINGGTFRP
jgi:hypothetical protein